MNELKKIAIFGAGGFGLEVAMLIEQINEKQLEWEIVGFFDDSVPKDKVINGYRVLGNLDDLNTWETELYVTFAISSPKVKRSIVSKINNSNSKYPILVHPSAILGSKEYLSIGEGCIICACNIITTNISIGKHVTLNLSCTVGHETTIGDFSSFMPTCNISGEVTIGKANFWGTGAKIINQKAVGDNVTIGAGAVVIDNIPDGVTAVGVPARIVRERT